MHWRAQKPNNKKTARINWLICAPHFGFRFFFLLALPNDIVNCQSLLSWASRQVWQKRKKAVWVTTRVRLEYEFNLRWKNDSRMRMRGRGGGGESRSGYEWNLWLREINRAINFNLRDYGRCLLPCITSRALKIVVSNGGKCVTCRRVINFYDHNTDMCTQLHYIFH